MNNTNNSNSDVQVAAEKQIFNLLEKKLGVELEANRKLYLGESRFTFIQPNFYNNKNKIIGEISAHIGSPKSSQIHKLSQDILKMLLFEKINEVVFRKMIVVSDLELYEKLQGKSILSESIRQFGIELVYIEIAQELREQILAAQKRQRMVNA